MGIWRCAISDFPAREVVDGVIVPVGADVIVEVIDTRRFFHGFSLPSNLYFSHRFAQIYTDFLWLSVKSV